MIEAEAAQLRAEMVRTHLMARDINDHRVLEAMRSVPRHRFLPPTFAEHAYEDRPIRIGFGQTISQPYMVALMTQLLTLSATDRILEIGTGSGYQTAILARLGVEVLSVERYAPLATAAEERMRELDIGNVRIVVRDGSLGYPDAAPYDAILVTAGSPQVPPALRAQLAPSGRLVCPVGDRAKQCLIRSVRTLEGYVDTQSIQCIFVPLIGAEGWPDSNNEVRPQATGL